MYANWLCAGRIGLGWAHDAFYIACHMFMHFSYIRTLFSIYLLYLKCVGTFLIVSPSLFLSLSLVISMTPKYKSAPSQNPLHFGASSSSDPTPSHIWFCDEEARKAFSENFSRWGIHSECRVILADFADTDLPDVIHSWGWESLCDISVICPSVLIQEFYSNMHGFDFLIPLFHTRIRGKRIIVTLELVSDVLRVPRLEFPDYPGCERLKTVFEDELKSAFCEPPFDWGKRQFTYYSNFAKDSRFFNMIMTFVLYPLSYYNSITESRTRFLLSLLEHLTIDFPSHFILSILDVYRDLASCDKLIFPSVTTRIIRRSSVPFLVSDHFTFMYAIAVAIVKRNEVQFGWGSLGQQLFPPVRLHLDLLHPHLLLPLLRMMCPLETSWCNFSVWMLALIHSLHNCIRWTFVSVVLHGGRRS